MSDGMTRSSLDWILQPSAFLQLSYPAPKTSPNFFPNYNHYGQGRADVLFVAGWAVIFWISRKAVMQGCFAPFMRWWLARQDAPQVTRRAPHAQDCHDSPKGYTNGFTSIAANGEKSPASGLSSRTTNGATSSRSGSPRSRNENRAREKKVVRFAEQGWMVAYYAVYWAFGSYIHYHAPYSFSDLTDLFRGFPHNPIPGPVKFYYLTQLACWLNQLVILNVEERRKDHWQMMSHHVITTILITLSYRVYITRVGCLILVLLDFCDILLPFAKMTKYMDIPVVPDILFGVFLISWLISRQGLYSLAVLSVYHDLPMFVPLDEEGTPFTRTHWKIFMTLLSILVVLLLFWLVMIVRVALKVVRGQPAEDVRSDDEFSDLDEADSPQPHTKKASRPSNKRRKDS